MNATHQACQISSSQLLDLHVYGGECSHGEYPSDSNKIMKLMHVKVDGVDVSSNIVHEIISQPFIWTIHSSDNAFSVPCCGQAMAEEYLLLFKSLPIGHHAIIVEVIRVPLQPNQPVEHDLAKWDINVVR